jgi:hypothetical protein
MGNGVSPWYKKDLEKFELKIAMVIGGKESIESYHIAGIIGEYIIPKDCRSFLREYFVKSNDILEIIHDTNTLHQKVCSNMRKMISSISLPLRRDVPIRIPILVPSTEFSDIYEWFSISEYAMCLKEHGKEFMGKHFDSVNESIRTKLLDSLTHNCIRLRLPKNIIVPKEFFNTIHYWNR